MITDADLEKMIEEWQDNCIVTRDGKGILQGVSNEYFGLMWIKKKGIWKVIELRKGALENAKRNKSKVWCPVQ